MIVNNAGKKKMNALTKIETETAASTWLFQRLFGRTVHVILSSSYPHRTFILYFSFILPNRPLRYLSDTDRALVFQRDRHRSDCSFGGEEKKKAGGRSGACGRDPRAGDRRIEIRSRKLSQWQEEHLKRIHSTSPSPEAR